MSTIQASTTTTTTTTTTIISSSTSSFSPILLSPSSSSHPTLTQAHLPFYDNSDQGSVDSDYTSLSSSKFYGHNGSTSSLCRQGRSQSIDELASTSTTAITTTIPTRHFNGSSNVNKANNDPLQFVKIHPNHDLIERAQEQLTIAETRKRLQENMKLSGHQPHHHHHQAMTTGKAHHHDQEDETDWSKAVENWRQKREQKRKQSLKSDRLDDEPSVSISNIESIRSPSPVYKREELEIKPPVITPVVPPKPSPPPPPPPSSSSSSSTNFEREQLKSNRIISKSPSPQRIRGPAKVHEIFIEKPLEIRGFGFKLEDGSAQRRPVYISTIEDGSPAEKAGLCIDDEVLVMNGENLEQMTFDQVRKLLKERNLRGSIKMLVRTYEEILDDNSQTVTTGPPTEHSRTPSPQKTVFPPSINTTSSVRPSHEPSPVYTCLPYPPSPPPPPPPPPSAPVTSTTVSLSSSTNAVVHQPTPSTSMSTPTTTSSLNIFTPKPFRPATSINLDPSNTNETRKIPIETTTKPILRESISTPLSNPNAISSTVTESVSSLKFDIKPAPLSSVESLLHGSTPDPTDLSHDNDNQSPMAQVRSSVEKQMNQLQQELLQGFSHSTPSQEIKRDPRPVNIPVDLTHAAIQRPNLSTPDRSQPIKSVHSEDLNPPVRPTSVNSKRVVHDVPISTNSSTHRPANELKITLSSPYPNKIQEKISPQRMSSKQVHTTLNQAPKQTHFEDGSWITEEQRRTIVNMPFQQNGTPRRAAPPPPPPAAATISMEMPAAPRSAPPNQLSMFHYGDRSDETVHQYHYHHSRPTEQHRETERRPTSSKQHAKSPIRTTINSNNNRVLSVSGKLRCSRCQDELGQGSAMVIESLGLYYHIECFRCFVCNIPLSSSFEGTDVRVRNNRLHCQNCFSDDNGAWRSNV